MLALQRGVLPSPRNVSLFFGKKFLSADVFLEQLISIPSSLHLIRTEEMCAPVCTLINICLVESEGWRLHG